MPDCSATTVSTRSRSTTSNLPVLTRAVATMSIKAEVSPCIPRTLFSVESIPRNSIRSIPMAARPWAQEANDAPSNDSAVNRRTRRFMSSSLHGFGLPTPMASGHASFTQVRETLPIRRGLGSYPSLDTRLLYSAGDPTRAGGLHETCGNGVYGKSCIRSTLWLDWIGGPRTRTVPRTQRGLSAQQAQNCRFGLIKMFGLNVSTGQASAAMRQNASLSVSQF